MRFCSIELLMYEGFSLSMIFIFKKQLDGDNWSVNYVNLKAISGMFEILKTFCDKSSLSVFI